MKHFATTTSEATGNFFSGEVVNDIRIQCINEDNNSVNLTSEDDHVDAFVCRCLAVHFFLHLSRHSVYQTISFELLMACQAW